MGGRDQDKDPIWLDACTMAEVANGDGALFSELQQLREDGHELLLVPAANNELLYGNPLTMDGKRSVISQVPSPKSRVKIEIAKTMLGVQVDMEGANLGAGTKVIHSSKNGGIYEYDLGRSIRVGYAMQDHVKRPRNLQVPNSLNNISESDSLGLGQLKASAEMRGVKNPVLFTTEKSAKAMRSQASVYGVTARGRSIGSPPPTDPPDTPKLPTIRINLILHAGGAALTAVSILVDYFAGKSIDRRNQRGMEEGMKALEPEIYKYLDARRRVVLDDFLSNSQMFLVVNLSVRYMSQWIQEDFPGGNAYWGYQMFADVKLNMLSFSPTKVEGETTRFPETENHFLYKFDTYNYNISYECARDEKQIGIYKALMKTITDQEYALAHAALSNRMRSELNQLINKTYETLDKLFSLKFQPDPAFWTDEGYRTITGGN